MHTLMPIWVLNGIIYVKVLFKTLQMLKITITLWSFISYFGYRGGKSFLTLLQKIIIIPIMTWSLVLFCNSNISSYISLVSSLVCSSIREGEFNFPYLIKEGTKETFSKVIVLLSQLKSKPRRRDWSFHS